MISAKPMIAFKGVRSSWLILARNSDFARLAASALSLLAINSALAFSSSFWPSTSAAS
jgi:hypothetical protein